MALELAYDETSLPPAQTSAFEPIELELIQVVDSLDRIRSLVNQSILADEGYDGLLERAHAVRDALNAVIIAIDESG